MDREEFKKVLQDGNWEATCTWGDGPDVLVSNKNGGYILFDDPKQYPPNFVHGMSLNGQFDLTIKQAIKLARELLRAANTAQQLEDSYTSYCENHGRTSYNES